LKKKSKVIVELHDPDDERVINGDYIYSHSRDYEVGDGVP